jgi:tetratricopeptide (TPR) repeat protein
MASKIIAEIAERITERPRLYAAAYEADMQEHSVSAIIEALDLRKGPYSSANCDTEGHRTEALASREKTLGPHHPDVASSLNNLALLYDNQGRYADAERLYQRALAINEKALGPTPPGVWAPFVVVGEPMKLQ